MKPLWLAFWLGAIGFGTYAMRSDGDLTDQIANCDCVPVSWFSDKMECFVYCDNETVTESSPLAGSYVTWINKFLYNNNNNNTQRLIDGNVTQPWSDHQFFGKTELECGKDGEKIHKMDVKMIHFKHCIMPKMLFQIFETAPQQALNMSHQNLKSIRPDTFEGAANLQTLIAHHNQLTAIPDNLFVGAKQLRTVDFSYNNIQSLNIPSLHNAHEVLDFNLAMNQIEELRQEHFAALDNMKMLNLTGNQIRAVKAETFAGAYQLQVLDLSHNNITILSSYAFENLTSLVELKLGSNPLQMLPVDLLVNLPSLRYLDLSHSQLFNIRMGTFSFNNFLEFLDLSHNLLDQFEFGYFLPTRPTLKTILLDNNKLVDTKGLVRPVLPNLETLSISNNLFPCDYLGFFFENVYWTGLKLSTNVSGITTNSTNMNGIACVPTAVNITTAASGPATQPISTRDDEDTLVYRNAAGEEIILKTSHREGSTMADIVGDVFNKTAAFLQYIRTTERDDEFNDYSIILVVAFVGFVLFFIYRYRSRIEEINAPEWNVRGDVKQSLGEYDSHKPYVIPVGVAGKVQSTASA